MSKFSFLILICFFFEVKRAYSQSVLLLPVPAVSWSTYLDHCNRAGFLCIDKFWEKSHRTTYSVSFDRLIDSFDSTSQSSGSTLTEKMREILVSEFLSVDQLEMLIALMKQINLDGHLISQELQKSLSIITEFEIHYQTADFYIFFKRKINVSANKRLQQLKINFPIYYYHYTQLPKRISTHTLNNVPKRFLFSQREKCQYIPHFSYDGIWRILQKNQCSETSPQSSELREKRKIRTTKAEYF